MSAKTVKRLNILLTGMILWLFLWSCGMPSSEYLYPPAAFEDLGGALKLTHDGRNLQDAFIQTLFRGYEFYYRCFASEQDAQNSRQRLDSLASTYEYTPETFIRQIAASGYVRLPRLLDDLNTTDNSMPPLIWKSYLADLGASEFTLHLYPNRRWTISSDKDLSEEEPLIQTIVRNKKTEDQVGWSDFSQRDSYAVGDSDFSSNASLLPGQPVYIVLCAVSYGASQESLGVILYSEPRILGPIAYYPEG
ncbi:MAG: hypothetical protein QHH01_00015 [Spirochaetales bacterium]|nr:hypothetical protein [Spirochaetales bacterium]